MTENSDLRHEDDNEAVQAVVAISNADPAQG